MRIAIDSNQIMKTKMSSFFAAATALTLIAGCAAPEPLATQPFRMNPYPMSSPEADQLKYPPGGGTGAYWLDGRFNVTLDCFIDETKEGEKAIFVEAVCFRQEGSRVYARNKTGQWFVLDLQSASFKKNPDVHAFDPNDQAALAKLSSRNRGNIYFDQSTLMPDL